MTESAEILRTSRPESEPEDEPELEYETEDETEDILPLMEKLFIFSRLNNCIENLFKYNLEPKIGVRILEKDIKTHSSNYKMIYKGKKIGEIKINFT